jgi:ABC-type sugar transport system permease subunit
MSSPNPYIEMLKYGSKQETVNAQTLADYLNEIQVYFTDTNRTTINTTTFRNAFVNAYQTGNGSKPDFNSGELYYLKPDALSYLLSYEALEESRAANKQSLEIAVHALKLTEKAVKIATWSFVFAIAAVIIQIVLSLILR